MISEMIIQDFLLNNISKYLARIIKITINYCLFFLVDITYRQSYCSFWTLSANQRSLLECPFPEHTWIWPFFVPAKITTTKETFFKIMITKMFRIILTVIYHSIFRILSSNFYYIIYQDNFILCNHLYYFV